MGLRISSTTLPASFLLTRLTLQISFESLANAPVFTRATKTPTTVTIAPNHLPLLRKSWFGEKNIFSSIFAKKTLTKEVSEDDLSKIDSAFPDNIKRVMWYEARNHGSILSRMEDRNDVDYEYFAVLKLSIPGSFRTVYAYFHSYTSQSGFDAFGGIRVVLSYSLTRLLKYGVDKEAFELIQNRYIPPYKCSDLDFALEYYRKLSPSQKLEFESTK